MEITNERTRRNESPADATTPSTDGPASNARERLAYPSDAVLSDLHDRLPSADYSMFSKPVHQLAPEVTGSPATRRKATDAEIIQGRLDDFRDRFSGPYHVDGATVAARPMFRMNTPDAYNQHLLQKNRPALEAACAKARLQIAMNDCIAGRGSPEQLVRVTQALIDAKRLPPDDAEHTTVESRIRLMQWQHGIGVDCAGYTQRAAAFVHGSDGRVFDAKSMGDIFTPMRHDPRFVRIAPADVRPGDVIHLDPPRAGAVGHNVIVQAHSQITVAELRALAAIGPGVVARDKDGNVVVDFSENTRLFLAGTGPFHRYSVDSSWGAGERGNDYGGFRRDTWLYDESSGRWATFTPGDPRLLYCDPRGPQGEPFAGAYRPASEVRR